MGFGIMKKIFNLVITIGKVEEFYKIYGKFSKEMESELAQIIQENDMTKFTYTISNLK